MSWASLRVEGQRGGRGEGTRRADGESSYLLHFFLTGIVFFCIFFSIHLALRWSKPGVSPDELKIVFNFFWAGIFFTHCFSLSTFCKCSIWNFSHLYFWRRIPLWNNKMEFWNLCYFYGICPMDWQRKTPSLASLLKTTDGDAPSTTRTSLFLFLLYSPFLYSSYPEQLTQSSFTSPDKLLT